MSFFTGTPGKWSQQSLLTPQQQKLSGQLQQANMGRGAGGSFGTAADYYRDLLSNDNETFNQFAQPELRRFRQETIPSLSEQFAGMGSGGLSSSGFRNAAVNAGTDLSERLGAIRAQLRQQGASGLMGLGQQGLNPTVENVYTQGQGGFLDQLAPLIGSAAGAFFNPAGGALSGLSGLFNKQGGTGGGQQQNTVNKQIYKVPSYGQNFGLPSYGQR